MVIDSCSMNITTVFDSTNRPKAGFLASALQLKNSVIRTNAMIIIENNCSISNSTLIGNELYSTLKNGLNFE